MSTLATLRAACQRRTGSGLDNLFYTDAINEALQQTVALHDWPWLEASWSFNTVVGQASYPWGTDAAELARIRSVVFNTVEMHKVSITDIDLAGRLEGWDIDSANLLLVPAPAAAGPVVVRYVRNEKTLVSDSDTPYLPDQYVGAVVAHVSALVYEREGNMKMIPVALARFEQWKKRMLLDQRKFTGPQRIRVTADRGL